jgi:hypothetical protein
MIRVKVMVFSARYLELDGYNVDFSILFQINFQKKKGQRA